MVFWIELLDLDVVVFFYLLEENKINIKSTLFLVLQYYKH